VTPGGLVVDVVVIGTGVEAMAIAAALARRGVRDVVVCAASRDTAPEPYDGAVYRPGDAPALVELARTGHLVLSRARELLGIDVGFRPVGRIVAAPDPAGPGPHAVGEAVGADVVAALWPEADLRDVAAFTHEADAGHVDPARVTAAFARRARRAGVATHVLAPVVAISAARDRVAGVRLADGTSVAAGTVVVAAGTRSAPLVAPLGVCLAVRGARAFAAGLDVGRALGARPDLVDIAGGRRLRVALDGSLLVGCDDAPTDAFEDELAARARAYVTRRCPRLPTITPIGAGAISWERASDGLPIVGPVGPDGLFVVAGCAGRGLAIVPAIADLAADLLCDGASRDPLVRAAAFRPDRFAVPAGADPVRAERFDHERVFSPDRPPAPDPRRPRDRRRPLDRR